jgi:hypothetical protein
MTEKNTFLAPRGLPGLKRKLSNLVQGTGFRGFTKKKSEGGSKSAKKSKTANKRHTLGTLTLQDIHEQLQLPNDLKEFNFDYSDDTNSFRYSFAGSETDRCTTNSQTNRFSFVSSTFEKGFETEVTAHQVVPDFQSEYEEESKQFGLN